MAPNKKPQTAKPAATAKLSKGHKPAAQPPAPVASKTSTPKQKATTPKKKAQAKPPRPARATRSKAKAKESTFADVITSYGCTLCHKLETPILCAHCKWAIYCSSECFDKDSAAHELVCAKYHPALTQPPRHSPKPGQGRYLALFLPWNSTEAEYVWIETTTPTPDQPHTNPLKDKLERYLGKFWDVDCWRDRGRNLQYFVSSDKQDDDLKETGENQCIKHLMAGHMLAPGGCFWGSMLVMAWSRDEETGEERYTDVFPRDFRLVVDHLSNTKYTTYSPDNQNQFTVHDEHEWIQGIRIQSHNDGVRVENSFWGVLINKRHRLFTSHGEATKEQHGNRFHLLLESRPDTSNSSEIQTNPRFEGKTDDHIAHVLAWTRLMGDTNPTSQGNYHAELAEGKGVSTFLAIKHNRSKIVPDELAEWITCLQEYLKPDFVEAMAEELLPEKTEFDPDPECLQEFRKYWLSKESAKSTPDTAADELPTCVVAKRDTNTKSRKRARVDEEEEISPQESHHPDQSSDDEVVEAVPQMPGTAVAEAAEFSSAKPNTDLNKKKRSATETEETESPRKRIRGGNIHDDKIARPENETAVAKKVLRRKTTGVSMSGMTEFGLKVQETFIMPQVPSVRGQSISVSTSTSMSASGAEEPSADDTAEGKVAFGSATAMTGFRFKAAKSDSGESQNHSVFSESKSAIGFGFNVPRISVLQGANITSASAKKLAFGGISDSSWRESVTDADIAEVDGKEKGKDVNDTEAVTETTPSINRLYDESTIAKDQNTSVSGETLTPTAHPKVSSDGLQENEFGSTKRSTETDRNARIEVKSAPVHRRSARNKLIAPAIETAVEDSQRPKKRMPKETKPVKVKEKAGARNDPLHNGSTMIKLTTAVSVSSNNIQNVDSVALRALPKAKRPKDTVKIHADVLEVEVKTRSSESKGINVLNIEKQMKVEKGGKIENGAGLELTVKEEKVAPAVATLTENVDLGAKPVNPGTPQKPMLRVNFTNQNRSPGKATDPAQLSESEAEKQPQQTQKKRKAGESVESGSANIGNGAVVNMPRKKARILKGED